MKVGIEPTTQRLPRYHRVKTIPKRSQRVPQAVERRSDAVKELSKSHDQVGAYDSLDYHLHEPF